MVHVHHHGSCDAPVSVAFAYLDDYRNATSWMFGLERFEPAGELHHGVGAVFEGTFHVRPVRLHSTVEVTEWEQDALIAFRSIKGFTNESTWRFSPAGDSRTDVDVVFSYDLPGGFAGRALGIALEPVVALSVRHSDAALRKHIEAEYDRSRNA
jgi:uncharacterized membrane protein